MWLDSTESFENFAKPGALVKLENKKPGRIADRSVLDAFKITNLDYLHEILNQFTRFLSLRPGTTGRDSVEKVKIDASSIGLYVGTIHLDDYWRSATVLHVYRIILLGNTVYAVKSNCVSLVETKESPA